MKLTTERLKEIIKEEVTAALTEGPDRKEQLRQAIEMWLTDTGLELEDAKELARKAKAAAGKPRWKDRPKAFQKIMDIGGPWGTGPELERAIEDLSYEIMGEEKPERAAQPEEEETETQRLRRAKRVAAIDAKMGGKYR